MPKPTCKVSYQTKIYEENPLLPSNHSFQVFTEKKKKNHDDCDSLSHEYFSIFWMEYF